ncbi:Nuclear pore complex protein NUP93B [Camellia lanceoleosa]|uniref:Nuclear pore complex protein NUP93B n=1 Tax=Camellia lanceoleosa TaxID=1840588 RepID=A0ACC0FMS4_9ERIC|nr:Nuclear pore complex protein NUP93B [Camellia lanceoleosa]
MEEQSKDTLSEEGFGEPQKSIQEIAKALTGSLISLKVIQADQENRKLIFSEKEAMWDVLKKMSLVIGARRHLEWGHEKYIIDTIQSHHAQVQEDFDLRCKELIKEEFGERCNFDVDDAVQKLEKLGIVAWS